MNSMTITRETGHYIVRNIFAYLGLSLYILIDTLFVSITAGELGLSTLNIVLPTYNFFNALGLMLGVGGATMFSLNKVRHPEKVSDLFSQLITSAACLGIFFIVFLYIFTTPVLHLLGANSQTMPMARPYFRIITLSAPFIMCKYITVNFVRNDGNPSLTMASALTETLSMIVMDYVLIFLFKMGMNGAALAAMLAPMLNLAVASLHRKFKDRTLTLHFAKPRLRVLIRAAQLGIAAFLNELSNGVSIFVFNWGLLGLGGNAAIAAYGVIANIALVVISMGNGVALGVQPIASREYGRGNFSNSLKALKLGTIITLVIALLNYVVLTVLRHPVVAAFNSAHSATLAKYAAAGIPIYFTCTFFVALNLLLMTFMVAINKPRQAFTLSILRGYIILIPAIIICGKLFGLEGVWASVPLTEFLVTLLGLVFLFKVYNNFRNKLDKGEN